VLVNQSHQSKGNKKNPGIGLGPSKGRPSAEKKQRAKLLTATATATAMRKRSSSDDTRKNKKLFRTMQQHYACSSCE
jgi:hypothetical protein